MHIGGISTQRLTRFFGLAIAMSSIAAALGAQPAAASPGPGRIITGFTVISGGDANITCPRGFEKNQTDLNHGSGGDYVYACERYGNDAARGISELYVQSPYHPDQPECQAEDQALPTDLESGVNQYDIEGHAALYFCVHRPNTIGGSARELFHPEGWRYYAQPFNKLLADVQFIEFSGTDMPKCVTTSCVAVNPVEAITSYLADGRTIDPYCQSRFGAEYHPLFRDWEYHGGGDIGQPVPQDAKVVTLNLRIGAPLIYACGRYVDADQIDTTPPQLIFKGNTFNYTVDQTVAITCDALDQPGSPTEVVSRVPAANIDCPNSNGPAYTFGLGTHMVNATATDLAGNVAHDATQFTVNVTSTTLCKLSQQLLGRDLPHATQACSLLSQAEQAPNDDTRINLLRQYEAALKTTALDASQIAALSNFAEALAPATINDTASALMYRGNGWGYYPDRPASFGNIQNDVHATMTDGDSVSLVFFGTGIEYITELSDGYGLVDVYLDGKLDKTVDANVPGVSGEGGQVLYKSPALPRTQHVISLVKRSGVYMLFDAFSVTP
jgi:hypothetical protein